MTLAFDRWICGPWLAAVGDPLLLLRGAGADADRALMDALDEQMTDQPIDDAPPPLPSFTAPGGLPHVDEVPAMSRGRWRPSVLEPRTVWAGCSDDVADFGAILAPVLEDVRRLGLLVAPTGFVSLFFDPRPAPGERTRAITWCPSAPDRFERRSLRAGTDFRATDLTHGRVVETFASSAPNAAVLADWPDLALHATLAVRRRISVMADQSRPLDRNREAELLRDLGEIAGVVAYLLEPDGER